MVDAQSHKINKSLQDLLVHIKQGKINAKWAPWEKWNSVSLWVKGKVSFRGEVLSLVELWQEALKSPHSYA